MDRSGAPLATLPIGVGERCFLNGALFGSVGALIAYSPLGRISRAHINPAMTFAFWLPGKLGWRDAGCYVVAQLAGSFRDIDMRRLLFNKDKVELVGCVLSMPTPASHSSHS